MCADEIIRKFKTMSIHNDNDKTNRENHAEQNIKIGTDFTFKREVVWFNTIGFLLLMITGVIGIYAAVMRYCLWQTTLWSEYNNILNKHD